MKAKFLQTVFPYPPHSLSSTLFYLVRTTERRTSVRRRRRRQRKKWKRKTFINIPFFSRKSGNFRKKIKRILLSKFMSPKWIMVCSWIFLESKYLIKLLNFYGLWIAICIFIFPRRPKDISPSGSDSAEAFLFEECLKLRGIETRGLTFFCPSENWSFSQYVMRPSSMKTAE